MVSLIACTIRDNMMENIFENYNRQLWKEKELIIILNKDSIDKEKWEKRAQEYDNVTVYQLPEIKTLGQCLNFGVEKAKFEIVAKFDDDDFYSPYYLTEAMEAFRKTNAQLIGKRRSYMYFEKTKLLTIRTIRNLKGGTLIFKKNIYPIVKFPSRKGGGTDSAFVSLCKKMNIRIHSTSMYNYVYIRKANSSFHTYKQSNRKLKQSSRVIGKVQNYIPIITMPFHYKEENDT